MFSGPLQHLRYIVDFIWGFFIDVIKLENAQKFITFIISAKKLTFFV